MWRGFLPLAALALAGAWALGPLAHQGIEAAVQRETRAQLTAAGLGWVGVAVSGQEVTLSGAEPEPGAGGRALAVVRAERCATWLGARPCALSVAVRFSPPLAVAGVASASPAQAQACENALGGAQSGAALEFASGSAALAPGSAPLLDRLAGAARACPGLIRIEGHTDLVGRDAFNLSLSQGRAAAVREALIARGVPADRLSSSGLGARRPLADNGTAAGRARNRRIEFHVASAGQH
jgi:outer membrane protein OmpA-like peptidoglycan-associated protein